MYKEDLFTIMANILGTPALSLPFGKGESGLPLGLQIVADRLNEGLIYNVADFIENNGGDYARV